MSSGWSERWNAMLSSFGWSPPVPASGRRSRIVAFTAGVNGAEADIRFAGEESHTARVKFTPLPNRTFEAAIQTMARKARFGASLLSGRIPFDTEGVFGESGRSLFPSRSEDVRLSCTCAEEGLLCSHVQALLGVIGTRLGGDPLLLFELRGLERRDLLARLKEVRSNSREKRRPSGRSAARAVSLEPLPKVRPDAFFKPTSPLSPRRPFFAPPEGGDLLPAWLGPVPFEDPQARALLLELHRAIGVGARERLSEWEWKKVHRKAEGE